MFRIGFTPIPTAACEHCDRDEDRRELPPVRLCQHAAICDRDRVLQRLGIHPRERSTSFRFSAAPRKGYFGEKFVVSTTNTLPSKWPRESPWRNWMLFDGWLPLT